MNGPCLNCDLRDGGCHDRCKKYQEFKRTRENINRKRFMANTNLYYPSLKRKAYR